MGDASTPSTPLTVGIVGAGIAGLAAAVALRRAGHHVELFEQSQFKAEVGAAITTTPNGVKVLRHWGIDPEQYAVKSQAMTYAHYETLDMLSQDSFESIEDRFGHAIYHWHRVDLHHTLREFATSWGLHTKPPASVSLGTSITNIDCDEGIIFLENGHQIRKDLLVIADGHKSRFNHHFHSSSQHSPLLKNGRSAYRAIVPFSAINAHPSLKQIFSSVPPGFYCPLNLSDSHTYFVTYPCRNNTLLNIALMHATRPKDAEKDDWHSPAPVEDVLETISAFNPLLHELIQLSPEITVYSLASREPLPSLARGRAVIVGDAAALMQPHTAQGGTIAIEQAGALELLFSGATRDQVAERAKHFDQVMRKRTHMVQLYTDAVPFDGTDPRRQRAAELSDQPLPALTAMPFTEEVREFLYHYNVLDEARGYLERKRSGMKGNGAEQ